LAFERINSGMLVFTPDNMAAVYIVRRKAHGRRFAVWLVKLRTVPDGCQD